MVAVLAATNRLGLRTEVVSAEGGGLRLEVEFPAVTRPGLPSPVTIDVTSLDGAELPDELVVRVTSDYLALFDQAQPSPQPSTATATSEVTEWTFDVASGARTTSVSIGARLHPSTQRSREDRARRERMTVDEVRAAAREQGTANMSSIRFGVMEPDGRFSFITTDAQPSTADGPSSKGDRSGQIQSAQEPTEP